MEQASRDGTTDALHEQAKELDIDGRSDMSRDELIHAPRD